MSAEPLTAEEEAELRPLTDLTASQVRQLWATLDAARPSGVDVIEAATVYRNLVMGGGSQVDQLEAWAVLDNAIAALDGATGGGDVTLDEALDLLEHPEHPRNDNTPAFWEGWHAALAAVRVALDAARPSGEVERMRQRFHANRDGCNGRPHRHWYHGENKCDALTRLALDGRREE